MAKKKDRKKREKPVQKEKKKGLFDLNEQQQTMLCVVTILIIIFVYFYPIVFENKIPLSTDAVAWRANANSIIEAREKLDYNILWANNVFAGMPVFLISLKSPFEQPARYLLIGLRKIIDWRVTYFIIGAIGMFLLIKFMGLSNVPALFTAFAFIWWPNLIGLLEAGHNSKIKVIMLMPFVFLTFLHLIKKPNLLYFSLFTILYSLGVQARHYQIMFYASLMLAFFGIMYFITFAKQKDWKGIGIRSSLIIGALIISIGISSFPALIVQDYSKYSIRGGTGQKESKGLSFDYATNWSLHPSEMFTFLMPRFFGGTSTIRYQGDDVPQLKGRNIPGYWGHMPFTSTTEYIGIIIIFLAGIAIAFKWREKLTLTFLILIIFSLLISFGKYFPVVYKFFFNFFPFFNKFRVPSMILVLVHFSLAVLSGFGVSFLLKHAKDNDIRERLIRAVLIIFGIFVFIGLVPFLFKNLFSFTAPNEISRYKPEILTLLQTARYDLMKQDAIRMLVLTVSIFVIVYAFIKRWLPRWIFIGGIVVLLLIDLFTIDKRFMNNLVKENNLKRTFTTNPTDEFLQKDQNLYRIFPIGELFSDTHWSYHHQTIGGYHPAKLRVVQDLIEFCLYNGTDPGFHNNQEIPINWNVVNMLNVKYVLAKGKIQHQNLSQVFVDQQNSILVYKNNQYLPRVFSVGEIEVIKDRKKRFGRINDPDFTPVKQAILEKRPKSEIKTPGEWEANITRYEPNYIDVNVKTDKQTLLVLSEIYYPAGWKAYMNNKQIEIFKTNHALRSVVVPPGEHQIEFKFEPDVYYTSLWISGVSIAIAYFLLIIALIPYIKVKLAQRKRN